MLTVTFITKTGHKVVEKFSTKPHSNGFVPDYKLRAQALNWVVIDVQDDELAASGYQYRSADGVQLG